MNWLFSTSCNNPLAQHVCLMLLVKASPQRDQAVLRLATRARLLCISPSFLTPDVTDFGVMASLSCTHLLFPVPASAEAIKQNQT